MAALILPSRRVVQPQEAVDIDWSNPLAVGIRSAMLHGRIIRQGGSTPPESGSSPYGVPQVTRNGRALQIGTGASNAGYLLRAGDVGPAVATGYLALTETRLAILQHRTAINYGISYSVPGGTTGGLNWRMLSGGRHQVLISGVGTMGEGRILSVGETAVIAMRARYVSGSFANGDAFTNGVFDGTGIYNGTIQGSAGGSIGGTSPATDPMREYGAMPLHVSWSRALSDLEIREVSANPWQLFRPLQRRIWVPVGAGAITGSLNVAETSSDTLAASGAVVVSGALAVTESGPDTLAASGDVVVSGSLAVTEGGPDTFAASGVVVPVITGSLAVTETGPDTLAASGSVLVSGSLAVTETGPDTFAAVGTTTGGVSGSLDATETGSDTAAISGAVVVAGALSASETGPDTFAGSGAVVVTGLLAVTENGPDTFAAVGFGTAISGALNAQESGSDTFFATEEGQLIDTHDGFWAKEWKRIRAREKRKYQEEIEERIEAIAEEISVVDEQIAEVKQAAKVVKFTPQPNFYAEQARIVEHLIARRNQLIDEEDEELLLLL